MSDEKQTQHDANEELFTERFEHDRGMLESEMVR